MKWIPALFALALAGAAPAHAEVSDVAPGGFSVTFAAHVTKPPAAVYDALVHPAKWWNPQHTYSGDAANLTLDARAGGCWCEALPDGGSVQHMTVVFADPGKVLRLKGALGPLQGLPVAGVMTWSLKPATDGTDIAMSYHVGGYAKEGFGEWSKAVDGVLAEQLGRLTHLIDGGSADAKP